LLSATPITIWHQTSITGWQQTPLTDLQQSHWLEGNPYNWLEANPYYWLAAKPLLHGWNHDFSSWLAGSYKITTCVPTEEAEAILLIGQSERH
jgi:hypothetical protein